MQSRVAETIDLRLDKNPAYPPVAALDHYDVTLQRVAMTHGEVAELVDNCGRTGIFCLAVIACGIAFAVAAVNGTPCGTSH